MGEYPFDVDDNELFHALGRVTLDFGILEDTLAVFIAVLINNNEGHHAYIAACELNYKSKLGVLMAEYNLRISQPEKIEQLRLVLEKLQDIETTRNTYIHSFWEKHEDRIVRQKPKSRIQDGYGVHPSTTKPKELNDFANRIERYGVEIHKIYWDYLHIIKLEQLHINEKNKEDQKN